MSGVGVGVLGCGDVSGKYFRGMKPFDVLDVVACADVDPQRARASAEAFGIARACSRQELLADPDVEIVVNLTPPLAHCEVNLEVIAAGKHLYSEKPLAATVVEGRAIIAAARDRGVRVGCAPDTFLGGALQTCRKLVDEGAIGRPVAATAFYLEGGHQDWHPDPRFFFAAGAGPMLDMGPYYLTALVALLGPVRRIAGVTSRAAHERTIQSEPLRGTRFAVEVDTHIAGTLEFASGAVASVAMSWDVPGATTVPHIEVHGTDGSLIAPDPNRHDGIVRVRRPGEPAWQDVQLTHDATVPRGIGVADLARAIRTGQPHRASGELALHVLEAMCAFQDSSDAGAHIALDTTCERPAALD